MHSYIVDRRKWAGLTLFEQMGNIGAEVGRALRAKRRGDEANLGGAFARGLDLFDATAEAWSTRRPSVVKEVLRAREQFAEAVLDAGRDDRLEQYFMNFALAARLRR